MIKLNKILVPTDFSKGAEAAYSVAQKVADTYGGTVDFIHVVPIVKYLAESVKKLGVPLDMNKDVYPKIATESEHLLKRAMDDYLRDETKGKFFVKIDRKPSETIVEHAKKGGYDLIIIGARGKHETKLLRGGTTEKVIRNSTVPVFSVDGKIDRHSIKNIMIPTDTSPLSLSAFPHAVALADTFQANITLFHVIELYGSISEDIPRTPGKGEMVSIYEVIIDRLNDHLTDIGSENIHIQRSGVTFEDNVVITEGSSSRSVPIYTKIVKGVSAHYEIESYAEENADLVVMATHGHSGFAHLILGSTAEKVAQYVSKPVITVRPDKSKFKK